MVMGRWQEQDTIHIRTMPAALAHHLKNCSISQLRYLNKTEKLFPVVLMLNICGWLPTTYFRSLTNVIGMPSPGMASKESLYRVDHSNPWVNDVIVIFELLGKNGNFREKQCCDYFWSINLLHFGKIFTRSR
jgi:hypothetical protein